MNNSNRTESGLTFDVADASRTLKALRANLSDREFVYSSLLAFAARNWGSNPFRIKDLRQAINFKADDKIGVKRSQSINDAMSMVCMTPNFARFIEVLQEPNRRARMTALYRLNSLGLSYLTRTTAETPVPGRVTAAVEPQMTYVDLSAPAPKAKAKPKAVVGNNGSSDQPEESLSMPEAITLIKRLYERNQDYEQTISTLYAKNQELENQIKQLQARTTSVKMDETLRKIVRSA